MPYIDSDETSADAPSTPRAISSAPRAREHQAVSGGGGGSPPPFYFLTKVRTDTLALTDVSYALFDGQHPWVLNY